MLRVVVVAEGQPHVPVELTKDEAFPLRVIRAATFQEAVETVYYEHGPRHAVCQYERAQCAQLEILDRPVSLERLYQALPLLREVKREQLPRAPRSPEGDDTLTELRAQDIPRWEEALRQEYVTYERVALEEVFERFQSVVKNARTAVPRFVVLGPPGSGKSTLIPYLAARAAAGELSVSGRPLFPVRIVMYLHPFGVDLQGHVEQGQLLVRALMPLDGVRHNPGTLPDGLLCSDPIVKQQRVKEVPIAGDVGGHNFAREIIAAQTEYLQKAV